LVVRLLRRQALLHQLAVNLVQVRLGLLFRLRQYHVEQAPRFEFRGHLRPEFPPVLLDHPTVLR